MMSLLISIILTDSFANLAEMDIEMLIKAECYGAGGSIRARKTEGKLGIYQAQ
jgi:hypothetical protein